MLEAAKHVHNVQVAGLSLKLRASHNAQTVSELIKIVDEKVKDVMGANRTVSFQNALLLAALNIAEELFLLKKTATTEFDKIEERTRIILDQIEDVSATTN